MDATDRGVHKLVAARVDVPVRANRFSNLHKHAFAKSRRPHGVARKNPHGALVPMKPACEAVFSILATRSATHQQPSRSPIHGTLLPVRTAPLRPPKHEQGRGHPAETGVSDNRLSGPC